jgi:RNA polymerase sigma-70 factor (ECF subfamily)
MPTSPNVVPFPAMPDRAADERFEQLVDQYSAILRAHIAQHCPRNLGIQVSDVEQDALVRLWRALRDERNVVDAASYIYRIAVTTTIDAVRRVIARREEQLADASDDEAPARPPITDSRPAPDEVVERRETMKMLMDAIAELPENRRRCVELHLQGFNTTDIAALLGWSEAKARNLVYRGMESLRDILKRKGIGPAA